MVTALPAEVDIGRVVELSLEIELAQGVTEHGRIWVLSDIRQDAGRWQHDDPDAPNFVTARVLASDSCVQPDAVVADIRCATVRTLDLYPEVPEFLSMCEIEFGSTPQATDRPARLLIDVSRWSTPERSMTRGMRGV